MTTISSITTIRHRNLPSVGSYRLNNQVFQVVENGMARLLDFERGRFYGLDRISTQMVTLLLSTTPQEAITRIARQYKVPESRVAADLAVVVHKLQARKVLVPTHHTSQNLRFLCVALLSQVLLVVRHTWLCLWRPGRRWGRGAKKQDAVCLVTVPSRSLVRLILILSWLSLRTLGWTATIILGKRLSRQPGMDTAPNQPLLEAIDRCIREVACSTFVLPMTCKERAIAGYYILQSLYGLPATLVIGTRRYPFEAHAWVQCTGHVLTDDREHCALFTPVATYA